MIACVAGVVAVTRQEIRPFSIRSVSVLNGSGSASLGSSGKPSQSIVCRSSRGGVPVFNRASGNANRSSVRARPTDAASPTRPAGISLLPDMNNPAQKCARCQHRRADRNPRSVRADHRKQSPAIDFEVFDSSGPQFETRRLIQQPTHRAPIQRSIRLRSRPTNRRTLAAI